MFFKILLALFMLTMVFQIIWVIWAEIESTAISIKKGCDDDIAWVFAICIMFRKKYTYAIILTVFCLILGILWVFPIFLRFIPVDTQWALKIAENKDLIFYNIITVPQEYVSKFWYFSFIVFLGTIASFGGLVRLLTFRSYFK